MDNPDSPLAGLSLREPPANIQAEQALLGAILANNRAFDQVAHFLKPEHFAEKMHGRIYAECARLIAENRSADPVVLRMWFETQPDKDDYGGSGYLADLLSAMVGVINAGTYGRSIQEMWARRQMIDIGEMLVNRAFTIEDLTPVDIVASTIGELETTLVRHGEDDDISLADAVAQVIENMQNAQQGEVPQIFSTGIPELDSIVGGGLRPADLMVLGGRPGHGKAQPLQSKILLENGLWTTIGDVRVGMKIASVDGSPSRVSAIFPRGQREVFRVTFSDGRSTLACADHLWAVRYREWPSKRVMSTSEVVQKLKSVRYRKRLSIERISGDFGEGKLPLDAYVMGALLGDGSFRNRTPRLTTADPEIVEEISYRLGLHCKVAVNAGKYAYSITSGGLSNAGGKGGLKSAAWLPRVICDLGLQDLKSHQKFIPQIYLCASQKDRLDLLRGLMDTDGYVNKDGAVYFTTTSRKLAEGVQYLVRSLGGQCWIGGKTTFYTHKGEKKSGLSAFVCYIRHERGHEFFTLKRKSSRAVRSRNSKINLTFSSIECVGLMETRCIQVTHPSSLYVTDEFIVTHNSALATQISASYAERYKKPVLIFTMEMRAVDQGARVVSQISGVPATRIELGTLSSADADRVVEAQRKIASLSIHFDDRPRLDITQLRIAVRRFKRRYGAPGLIVVDHMHLMRLNPADVRLGVPYAVGQLANALKEIAKDEKCPVIALAQLNRSKESADDKVPTMSDLKNSGDIEAAADIVLFTHREELHLHKASPSQKIGESDSDFQTRQHAYSDRLRAAQGKADLVSAKVRKGPTGAINVDFDGPTTTFIMPH